jgi:nucleoside-diphosphate-sugar epimerase
MKYLVTGGAGFIGSNLVKALLKKGEVVSVLDNFSTGRRENIIPYITNRNFRLIEGDLRSSTTVTEAVKGVDYILHQGALPSVPRSINDPVTSNNVNILGTLNILEAAREAGVKRVVYASSSSVYGNSSSELKSESLPVMPMSPYALTKYAGERYCQIFYEIYGLETVCLRYFNVFGINQDPSSQYSAVIPKFIKKILNDEPPEINGDGTQSRDFTFAANNVEANLLACEADNAKGEVINIACGESYTLLTLVEEINRILNKNIEPVFKDHLKGDVKHSKADISKAIRTLNYCPKVKFAEGLERTTEHLMEQLR